nr:hypothetical protein [Tanacetum cinerariifolium]
MFYQENVDYPELIWEDLAFLIDRMQLKKGRRKNMPYLRLKFVRIGEDFQKYGLSIPETMLTEGINRRVIKKKVSIFADDNIIPEPDVALELGKSKSLTESTEEEVARQVHATHEMIINKRQPNTRGSSEGTGSIPRVLMSPQWSSLSSEETDTDEEEEKNDHNDDKSIDLEKTDDEETDNEFMHSEEYVQDDDEETDDETVHGEEQVNDNEDEEMTNAKDADTGNGDEKITNAAKADAKKEKEVKDDTKKAELPPSGSSLYISLGFCNQFLNLSSDTSLIGTIKDTRDAEINSLLDVQIQQEIPC